MNPQLNIPDLNLENYSIVFLITGTIGMICTILVILSIIVDFMQYHRPQQNKKKINSWVETGSMFVFFFIYFLLMKPAFGKLPIQPGMLLDIFQIIGAGLLIIACYVNLKGRMILKDNWANQVTIYHDHTLVTSSVYGWVRHPLYASLTWMFVGGSFIYGSYLSFLSVFVIFVPMMYYRAEQEEKLLETEFQEYSQYKKRVGMLFPKLF